MVKQTGRNGKAAVARAAPELVAEKGITATTTRDIAERAGKAEGTIYRHYKSKESLSKERFSRSLSRFTSYLQEHVQSQKTPVGKFRAIVQAFFAFARQEPPCYQSVIFGHLGGLPAPTSGTLMPKDVFTQLMREGMERGVFQQRDENLAASLVIGALSQVVYFKQHGLIEDDYEQIIPQVTEACLRMISPEDLWAAECC